MQLRLVAAAMVAAACSRASVDPAAAPVAAAAPSELAPAAAPAAVPDPSPALAAESAWSASSADGRITVVHAAASGGRCSVAAIESATGRELWRSDACLGWRTDPVFVSPSGDRVLVLHAGARGDGPDWSSVQVASLFERGKLVREFRGAELVAPARIAAMRAEETWGRGLKAGTKEPRPGYDPADRVRIDTIDGRVVHVGFDGTTTSIDPAAVAAAAGPAADDEAGLYRWTDDAGQVHYTNGADIPQEYRSRAKPVRAQIGVVPVERISRGFASSGPSWTSSPARRASPPAPARSESPPAAPTLRYGPPRELNHFERSAEAAWGASMGYGGVKINQKPQVCTTKGDITSCRDAN